MRSRASGGAGQPHADRHGSDVILPATKVTLVAFTGLTLLAFVTLFVLSSKTDRYFAWPVVPPTTAAFLGAAYGAGSVLVVLGLRSGRWDRVRLPYLTILIFTVVTAVATLRHIDRFSFRSAAAVARVAAWVWLAIYLLVPLAMAVMLVVQERRRSVDRRPRRSVPMVIAVPLVVQAGLLLSVGVVLFVRPEAAGLWWPWTLSELTARMVAAWLLAFGVAAVLILRQGEVTEARASAWAYAVFGVLELIVAFRYPATVRWGSVAAWLYLIVAASVVGVAGWSLARRPGTTPSRGRAPGAG